MRQFKVRRGLKTFGASLLLSLSACASPEPQQQEQANAPAQQPPAAPQQQQPQAQSPPPDQPGQPPGPGGNVLDELARELTLREQEGRALAQHYFRAGMRFYESFDYRKAAENFQKAHDADPANAEIRHFLLQSQLLAGDRIAEFETISELLRQQRDVSIELEKAELKRLYQEGEELLRRQEFARAITRFEQVLEKIRWFPYKVDTEGYEDSARRYIVTARRSQRERELAEAEAREQRALSQAREEEERNRREAREQVEQLLRQALDQLAVRRYDDAQETIEEILIKDPGNEEAIKLQELAIEQQHNVARDEIYYRNRQEHAIERENVTDLEVPYLETDNVAFPDREYWMGKVRQRHIGISRAQEREPDWIRDYRQVLKSRKVTLNFPETPFAEVISFLQDITGLNITVSPAVDQEEVTVSLRLRDIPLEDALKIILEQTQLAMAFKNETLMITPPDEARGEYDLEIYDVQDLLSRIPDFPGDRIRLAGDNGGGGGGGGGGAGSFSFDTAEEDEGVVLDPDQLETIITNAVGEDNWDDPASIEIHKGQIIVNQTRELHAQVREVLKNLRRNTGLFVQVETRFINMTDDFLRDVGVDFRDQGTSAPIFGHTPALTLDPSANIPTSIRGGNGHDVIGFGRQIPAQGNARAARLGPVINNGQNTLFGSSMFGGRTENVLDGGTAFFSGQRLNSAGVQTANSLKGLAFQAALLDPFQINAILRAEEENARRKIVQAPVITAANRQRVHVSVITQRAYISDYELSSGGTGLTVAEVADPIVETFQEGIVLDVRPTISADRKYITLDVRPTLATLVGGSFRQIQVNLGTVSSAAINVNIEVPQIVLQEAFTSVTLPDGGTALLGGFRNINQKEEHSGVPFIDHVPLINKLFSREAELNETSNLIILVTARMISVRDEEARRFNVDDED
jgi:type II secretory pathway component GspD/PulD (secretin)